MQEGIFCVIETESHIKDQRIIIDTALQNWATSAKVNRTNNSTTNNNNNNNFLFIFSNNVQLKSSQKQKYNFFT